jgi:hypothetical protein
VTGDVGKDTRPLARHLEPTSGDADTRDPIRRSRRRGRVGGGARGPVAPLSTNRRASRSSAAQRARYSSCACWRCLSRRLGLAWCASALRPPCTGASSGASSSPATRRTRRRRHTQAAAHANALKEGEGHAALADKRCAHAVRASTCPGSPPAKPRSPEHLRANLPVSPVPRLPSKKRLRLGRRRQRGAHSPLSSPASPDSPLEQDSAGRGVRRGGERLSLQAVRTPESEATSLEAQHRPGTREGRSSEARKPGDAARRQEHTDASRPVVRKGSSASAAAAAAATRVNSAADRVNCSGSN